MTGNDDLAAFARKLMGEALGFRRSAAVLTAVQRNLFDRIGEGASLETVRRPEEDPRALERLCRALVGLGLLEVEEDAYRCPPEVRACLTDEGDADLRPILRHLHEVYEMWGDLDRAIEEGPAYRFREEDEETFTPEFIAAMEARSAFDKAELAEILAPRLGSGRLLDLAGGSGVYARAVLERAPGARAVVADLPDVISEAREYVRRDGLGDRVDVRPLDLLEDETYGEGFDLVLISSVLHMFGPDEVQTILDRTGGALADGGIAAIRDYLLNETKTGPPDAVLFDLMMLLATETGRNYTLSEYRSFLEAAGFGEVERVELEATADSLLLARGG